MENKTNDSTPLRPQGERVLNADLVEMDLNVFINQIRSETTWQENAHNSITLYKSDAMRIVLIGMHATAELKTHTANGFINVQVIEGTIVFNTTEKKALLHKGQMIALQPKIPHSVEAKSESFFLLTLVPQKD